MKESNVTIGVDPRQQKKGRIIFLLLAIFFCVPLVVVVAMIKLDWRPTGKSYGQLIQPPISIAHTSGWATDKKGSADHFWMDKWNLVFVTHHCDVSCLHRLHDLRQIYVSMYKDMVRVQRVLITEDAETGNIRKDYPDLLIINAPQQSLAHLAQLLSNGGQSTMYANRVYLIDPLGNVMMQYALETDAKYLRKDLVKLLRSSWAG